MSKMHVRTGDTVMVISGADKGKKGKIQKAYPETGRVIVEGVNIVKKHQKPRGQGVPGGIVEKEAAISVSNVMIVAPSAASHRVGQKFGEGDGKLSRRKVRVCKKCSAVLDN